MQKNINIEINHKTENLNVEVRTTDLASLTNNDMRDAIFNYYPGVYILNSKSGVYVGESGNLPRRLKDHESNKRINSSHEITLIQSKEFNKSAVYDLETKLIDYMFSSGEIKLKNTKINQSSHHYYMSEQYGKIFPLVWDVLLERGIIKSNIKEIEDSHIFKFSPYKILNVEQYRISEDVEDVVNSSKAGIILIEGLPGTGKSILASKLYSNFKDNYRTLLTAGTNQITNAYKKVFKKRNANGSSITKKSKIISEGLSGEILIIDEAHRLLNKTGKGHGNKYKHMAQSGFNNELEALISKFDKVIVLYDDNQTVHDGDIFFDFHKENYFNKKVIYKEKMCEQMRITKGCNFDVWVTKFIDGEETELKTSGYDLKVFDNLSKMMSELRVKTTEFDFVNILSGYTRSFNNRNKLGARGHVPIEGKNDFEIDGVSLNWANPKYFSNPAAWLDTPEAKNLKEVAYYNAIQGFNLNYSGVIIGLDLRATDDGEIFIDEEHVVSKADLPRKNDPEYTLKINKWIRNRYKILLTRAALGTYIYIEDDNLRKLFKKYIN